MRREGVGAHQNSSHSFRGGKEGYNIECNLMLRRGIEQLTRRQL